MKPRKSYARKKPKIHLILPFFFMVIFLIMAALLWEKPIQAPNQTSGDAANKEVGMLGEITEAQGFMHVMPELAPRIVDFTMKDLYHGWAMSTSGMLITEDSGISWTTATKEDLLRLHQIQPKTDLSEQVEMPPQPNHLGLFAAHALLYPEGIHSKEYKVSKVQYMTRNAGWVLVTSKNRTTSIWATVDGGFTWHTEMNDDVLIGMNEEMNRIQLVALEAGYYEERQEAQDALKSQWTLMPQTIAQGDILLVRHQQGGEVKLLDRAYPLQAFGTGYYAYIPIPMDIKPGDYPVGDQTLTVLDKEFETQYLKVTGEMEGMRYNTERIQADQLKINAARSKSEPEFIFSSQSEFIIPLIGRLTTPYGYTRFVNGKYSGSHRAIDIAAPEGTPLKATNDGIVALAEELYLTGNAIYIDHGMGLFSQYAHLSELHVKVGDRVKQGEIVGLVGTTGFSTGPHLHFTFWAHNVPVNPNLFFGTTPFHWLKN